MALLLMRYVQPVLAGEHRVFTLGHKFIYFQRNDRWQTACLLDKDVSGLPNRTSLQRKFPLQYMD